MSTDTLLFEIGTEELPPTAAKKLSDTLSSYVSDKLLEAGFSFNNITSYVTPRRIALSVSECSAQQPEQDIERKGPHLKAAYDADGHATKAALGFAKSCGVEISEIETLETDKGAWLYYKSVVKGKSLQELLPDIIEQGLAKLPIPRPMRWGSNEIEFVRPIHWVLLMYGGQVIDCKIKSIQASNKTYGHRFHAPSEITLAHANDYAHALSNAYVVANFEQRKDKIISQLDECATKYSAQLDYSSELLEEVTNLVEWPCAIVGEFSPEFLAIPHEALVVTMQEAQRYFPMFAQQDKCLLNHFITIANIESTNPNTIKRGNERVIKPRFSDAEFFWQRDKQTNLASRSDQLKGILFEKQLGSIFEKSQRIQHLVSELCKQLGIDDQHAVRAAMLCKSDLMTDMVNEFPKLQGIMGRYYALNDNEAEQVAIAIEEHYQPLQSGSKLPSSSTGKAVAICDRIDTLVGIFATGKKPSGVKDPYALRRAALGLVRIAIEGKVDFNLTMLLTSASVLLQDKLDISNVAEEVHEFILERLRGYFVDQGIEVDTFEAVRAVSPTHLLDFSVRIQAVQHFRTLTEASSLSAGNKRIRNILKKSSANTFNIDERLFSHSAESELYLQSTQLRKTVEVKFLSREYTEGLTDLATLRPSIDKFFDEVMVMDENESVRNNRIALLASVNDLFTSVADISLLQS